MHKKTGYDDMGTLLFSSLASTGDRNRLPLLGSGPTDEGDGAAGPTERTILVVDDDPLNRFLMCEALAPDGYRLEEAVNGEDALRAYVVVKPDLVLLDIDMPGIGGLAACRALRDMPGGKVTPIVMVTGLDEPHVIDDAFDSGASDFLAKPLNWRLVRQRVRFMLRHGAVTRSLHENEQVLDQVQSMVMVGHWRWNLVSGRVEMSARARKIFAHVPPTYENMYAESAAPGGDELRILDELKRAMAQRKQNLACEYDIVVPGKGARRIFTRAEIEYADGAPVRVLGSSQDVTQRHQEEERFAAIFHRTPVGIIEADFAALWRSTARHRPETDDLLGPAGEIPGDLPSPRGLRMNISAERMLGTSDPSACFSGITQFGTDCLKAALKALAEGANEARVQREVVAEGRRRHLVFRVPLPSTHEESQRVVVSVTDITDLIEQQTRLLQADVCIRNSNDGIALISAAPAFLALNPAFTRISGYTLEQLEGRSLSSLLAPTAEREESLRAMHQSVEHQGYWRGELNFAHRSGEVVPLMISISSVKGETGEFAGYVVVATDITQLKETERRLFHLAHHDPLTKLPNRLALHERLEQELAATDGASTPLTLLYIDLDGFKLVNDSMGHVTGDTLLAQVAQRLKAACAPMDMLARIGGDEFALLMLGSRDRQQIFEQAQQMLGVLQPAFHLQGRAIFIGASIGACCYPDDATNAVDMLRNADTAMYEAKRLGRGQLCFWSSELTAQSARRLAIESELRSAISGNELFLAYQPKYDANSGAVVGAEALVRWRSPTRGVIQPGEFIPVAEESGLVIALGEWVINEACRQLAAWRSEFGLVLPVAVNISALHLRQPSLLEMIRGALAAHRLDPSLLEIEITEDSLGFRGETEAPMDIMNQLYDMGLSIAIDDFGTGYSSLSQLKKLPIKTLKIDRSFIHDLNASSSDHAIIAAIVQMGKTLDMKIVAEGVETDEQATVLRELHCDVLQGFLYARPMTPAALGELIALNGA